MCPKWKVLRHQSVVCVWDATSGANVSCVDTGDHTGTWACGPRNARSKFMPELGICTVCIGGGRLEDAADVATVACNVREFSDRQFIVWRCRHCRSLHCAEGIDHEQYYRRYPIQGQRQDLPTRLLFASRRRQLERGGVRASHSLLDFGCGNGGFVEFLRDGGYAAVEGFDPYSKRYADRRTLERRYDVVMAQDAIEHVPDPGEFLDEILGLVANGGMAVIGTPDAAALDLDDVLDRVGRLHQPYHQHILSSNALTAMIESRGFAVSRVEHRWYADTLYPFINSRFLFGYVNATGGVIDAAFEPWRADVVLRSPRLLMHGLVGGCFNPRKDVVVFATRDQA